MSAHYRNERRDRESRIRQIGYGYTIKTCIVDRGHVDGAEIHKISSTGIITVFNKNTGRLVTKMIARPGQIRRYFPAGDVPKGLLDVAYYNSYVLCYNY